MKAVVYHGIGDIRLDDIAEPEIESPTDVIIKVNLCSICGSDIHVKEAGLHEPGMIIGHEYSGVVVETGQMVSNFMKGDRIIGKPFANCGHCFYCEHQQPELCENVKLFGLLGTDGVQAEYAFTSAILEVTGVSQKKVYFLTGHGEASIDASFSKAGDGLRDDLYLVDTLNLMTSPSIPDDCAVLIIAAPQNTLTNNEVDIIDDYLQSGGQALILANPGSLPDINSIISPWGVGIGEGTVIDPSSSVAPYQDMPLVPEDRNYFLLPGVYFPGATAIVLQETVPGNVSIYPLVWTSASSWLDMDFAADEQAVFDPETEIMGELAIGAIIAGIPTGSLSTDDYTRLVVIGDSDFASNDHFDSANNGDLFLNSVSWLAEEESLISIRRNVQPFRRLVLTEGQKGFIEYSSVILLPILVLAVGGVIWWRRR